MTHGLLPGSDDKEVARLKRELVGLEKELADTKAELQTQKQASSDAIQAIRAVREQLEPFHKALKMLFGEISRVSVGESASPGGNHSTAGSPKIEMLKAKLGGRQAEFIELLQHGPMTGAQLKAAAHCGTDTVYSTIKKLKAGGIVQKNGNEFYLVG